MATIERRYLAPLNPKATITESDRAQVYSIIGKELADILEGSQSYYPDGAQKDDQTQVSDLNRFIGSIRTLQSQVDDPSNILEDSIKSLADHAKTFQETINREYPTDHIEIQKELSPTTNDMNEIYVGPFDGYPIPNPLLPKNGPKYLRVSFGAQNADDTSPSGKSPARILGKFVDGKRVMPAVDTPPAQSDSPANPSAGQPVPPWSVPTPRNLRDRSVASGKNDWINSPALALVSGNVTRAAANVAASSPSLPPSNDSNGSVYPIGGGLAGWIAALAGIDPDHPDQWAPSPQAADIDNFAPNALAQSRLLRSR